MLKYMQGFYIEGGAVARYKRNSEVGKMAQVHYMAAIEYIEQADKSLGVVIRALQDDGYGSTLLNRERFELRGIALSLIAKLKR